MHIVFIASHYENLGIEYLSACLKKAGHTTSLLFEPALFGSFFAHNKRLSSIFNFKEQIIRRLIEAKPDIIAFSVISDNFAWACDLSRSIKKNLDVPIVFGGIHPTSVPERVIKNDCVDYVVMGEAEEAMLEFIDAFGNAKDISKIRNICFKDGGRIIKNGLRPPINDLDSIPFPDKELFLKECPIMIQQSYMVVASRGCRNSCSYCVNSFINKIYKPTLYYRRRSIGNVIKELLWAKEKFNIKSVTFYDEIFTADREWLNGFLGEYKRLIRKPFFCCLYPNSLDKKLVKELAEAGCSAVNIGIQTISENIRKDVLNRHGTNEEIARSIELLKEYNMFIYANVMLGLPKQDEGELLDTLSFCSNYKPDISSTYWLRYYPKTAIIAIAQENGLLSEGDVESIEEAREYLPYAIKGNTYSPRFAKIGNLILLSGLMPRPFIRFIIRHKLHRLMPARNLLFPVIVFAATYRKFFSGKKKTFHYLSTLDYIKYYLFYMVKKTHIHRYPVLNNKAAKAIL